MNKVSPEAHGTQPLSAYDRKFAWVAYGLLVAILLISTYLHHFQPQVFSVPNNGDISAWKNPTLEETTIYDRMTPAERDKVRRAGIPLGTNLTMLFIMDLTSFLFSYLCFLHARKYFGFWMASCFLIGSFVFTGLEESMWILVGRNIAPGTLSGLGEPIHGTYFFSKGGFWFFETPITACIGWFYIAYSCVLIAGKVFPRMGLWGRAAIGGLIAMGIDLWVDPVQTSPELMNWVWAKGDIFLFFGIPHSNFVGWFLLIFLFAIFWEKLPQMEKKWGRPRATIYFFLLIFATELCILVFFIIWLALAGGALKLLGVTEALKIPPGW